MKTLFYILMALTAGGMVAIQGTINSGLSKRLNHPMQASLISFAGAVPLIIFILLVLQPKLPEWSQLRDVPSIYYTGGAYGVMFVTTILFLAPKIGIANTLVATIVGQLIFSVVLDHIGFLDLVVKPINIYRAAGCVGLLLSLYLIQKS
ncbi:MAG: DMT family transporter [bacterium]